MSHRYERRCRSGPPSAPHQTALEKIWFWAVVGAGRAGRHPTARAGRWPPGMHTITRNRKLSRSGTRMCHPGGGLTADLGTILLRAPPPAQPPHQLCASHRPVCALRSTQHGGSDHRRPSNLETGAPVPTPFAPKTPPSTKVSLYVFLHLHSSFTGYPVAWVTKPHPSPPHRPPRWLLPTTTLCSAETDPNSPRCPCPSPSPANAESMLSKDDTPEPAVLGRWAPFPYGSAGAVGRSEVVNL